MLFRSEARLELAEGEACDTRWADLNEIEGMLESGEMVGTLRYILDDTIYPPPIL